MEVLPKTRDTFLGSLYEGSHSLELYGKIVYLMKVTHAQELDLRQFQRMFFGPYSALRKLA